MVTGPVYKHFDLERKNARRAEARLRQRLHTLEYICLYQMKLLTWEQRQLQKELQRLQQGKASGIGERQGRAASHCLAEARVTPPPQGKGSFRDLDTKETRTEPGLGLEAACPPATTLLPPSLPGEHSSLRAALQKAFFS